jgi:tricorn protease
MQVSRNQRDQDMKTGISNRMNIKKNIIAIIGCILSSVIYVQAQVSAKLMRNPDVSATHITFVYGGDIWLAPKSGGTAIQITNSPGEESFPRFSPDGSEIGYTAAYNGNLDVYVMSTKGGTPTRVTYQSHFDRMVDWHPEGNKLLFASNRQSGARNTRQFYLVSKEGGMPEKLAIPYGDLASFSPDGNKVTYVQRITENYPFKRYRGGLATDVIVFDLNDNTAEKITKNDATDGKPAWNGDNIFFVSDQAENMRRNIWVYDTKTKSSKQLTSFEDFDINYMSSGPEDLIFEAGGILYLMSLGDYQYKPIEIKVVSDLSLEMPRTIETGQRISNFSMSPKAKRVVFESRGDIYSVPAEEGYTQNYTNSSGAFDRNPSWSPDGKYIAYWSDKSGENEIYLQPTDGNGSERKLTNRGSGFGYNLFWSPDSKKIAYADQESNLNLIDATSGSNIVFDNTDWMLGHGGLFGFSFGWSPDNNWIAYSKGLDNANNAIFLYNLSENKTYQVTSAFYNNFDPQFGPDGKYLFFFTQRNFTPAYSSMGDGTWIYPNATQLAAVSLRNEIPSLLQPKNDSMEMEENEEEEKENGEDEEITVTIDRNNFESRITILPPDAGNFGQLVPLKGKVVYLRRPNTGSGERDATLQFYDIEERKEETILGKVQGFAKSADGNSLIVRSNGKFAIIKASKGQKMEKTVPTTDMKMSLNPKEEWRQIYNDTWRRYRDFFYDSNMQQVDWLAMKAQYGPLIEDARSRWDVSNILVELISELSAGHTYAGGGDVQQVQFKHTGNLGIDWRLTNGKYQVARIVTAAEWDHEVRSPFSEPGSGVKAGDYILSVNEITLDPSVDPYAAFEGLSGKTVSLKVSSTGSMSDSREVLVKCLSPSQETRLRHLEWIEENRKKVDELSNGQLAYMYMPNTGGLGQIELLRQFYGQLEKKGFVIDERFNGGGALSDRFMEMLSRPTIFNLHWRHGKDHQWPLKGNDGPKAMLINGSAGSGGDAFPWAFKELKAGPIIGERTLGILVGPATGHGLIDGGYITVPGARLYQNNGEWFWEGVGVSPDIEIWDDPEIMATGRDPQLERAVEEVLQLLEQNPNELTPAPAYEDRTAEGLGKGKK